MRKIYPATLLCDFYKVSHKDQYPANTEKIYSTWTPRASRVKGVDHVVAFGFQAFIKEYLIDYFNEMFFNRGLEEILAEYSRVIKFTLGVENPDTTHIRELHELGYLPIKIMAVPEGTLIPIRVPMLTIENTDSRFFWLTNYLETLMSCQLWQPTTSATIAFEYRKILEKYAKETVGSVDAVGFQGHDFSMRGMSSLQTAKASGAGHLLSFEGTDTIPAILYMEEFYNANIETELIGTSIPATEHSVQCSYGQEEELETYRHLIKEVYPKGFVSIVSDTWDLWSVLTKIVPELKEDIMSRDGRVVIRPDSGNPVDIICGTALVENVDMCVKNLKDLEHLAKDEAWDYFNGKDSEDEVNFYYEFNGKVYKAHCTAEYTTERGGYTDNKYYVIDNINVYVEEHDLEPYEKGVIEILWEIFGGTITEKGYKQLDSHIGAIYGDAITTERCIQICERLKAKGFASTNMVYGIGSFTYQYNTRDTFGFALKTTYAVVDGVERKLFKNPITDKEAIKKSQKGLVVVIKSQEEGIHYIDDLNLNEYDDIVANLIGDRILLQEVFLDGKLLVDDNLSSIRTRLRSQI